MILVISDNPLRFARRELAVANGFTGLGGHCLDAARGHIREAQSLLLSSSSSPLVVFFPVRGILLQPVFSLSVWALRRG